MIEDITFAQMIIDAAACRIELRFARIMFDAHVPAMEFCIRWHDGHTGRDVGEANRPGHGELRNVERPGGVSPRSCGQLHCGRSAEHERESPDSRRCAETMGVMNMTLEEVAVLIRSTRLRFGSESELQDDVEALLTQAGIKFVRECAITKRSRIDFRLDCGIGLECKVDGSVSEITPQLMNYAESPKIESLLLVTSRARHRFQVDKLRGKPFGVVWVGASSL